VRPLAQGDAVIFGAGKLVSVIDSDTGFNVLSRHELTHLYHMQVNREMREMIRPFTSRPLRDTQRLYQYLARRLPLYRAGCSTVSHDKQVVLSDTVAEEVARDWPQLLAV